MTDSPVIAVSRADLRDLLIGINDLQARALPAMQRLGAANHHQYTRNRRWLCRRRGKLRRWRFRCASTGC